MAVETPVVDESSLQQQSPPPPDQAAQTLPHFDLLVSEDAAPAGSEVASHYERTHLRVVKPGDAVAVLREREGNPSLVLGRNTALANDGVTIRATIAGRLRLENGKICVDNALEIPGNVDFSVGHVDFPGDVIVQGNILDLFKVHSGGSITVGGAIEAAEVRAARDVRVKGSIVAKDRGAVVAGGAVHAKYITNAKVQAGADICCAAAIANSQLICGGKIDIRDGAIVAGKAFALGGVICKTLGNDSGVLTLVEVGIDEVFRRDLPAALAAIDAKRHKARKIEQTVQPLLQNQKALTAAQKEKATELLFEAQEMAQHALKASNVLKERYTAINTASKTGCEILVHGALFPGVIIRFRALQTRIMSLVQGPARITMETAGRDRIIRLTDITTGDTRNLGCETIPDPLVGLMAKLAA
jgi:uncharacterized protein (DUF342 family)